MLAMGGCGDPRRAAVDAGVALIDAAVVDAPPVPPRSPCGEVDCAPCEDTLWCQEARLFETITVAGRPGACCPTCQTFERGECSEGCEREGIAIPFGTGSLEARSAQLCSDTPTRQLGDPCVEELDCKPNRAELGDDGELRTVYLTCLGKECVEDEAPVVARWRIPCALASVSVGAGEVQFDRDCFIARDADSRCLRSGYSRRCSFDFECPQGAFCRAPDDQAIGKSGLCKSGPPGDFSDYECSCPCNWEDGACDARADGDTEACPCDPDCLPTTVACSADRLCDPRCETGEFLCADPDCVGSFGGCDEPRPGNRRWTTPPVEALSCDCDFTLRVCDAPDPTTGGDCRCDPDCYL